MPGKTNTYKLKRVMARLEMLDKKIEDMWSYASNDEISRILNKKAHWCLRAALLKPLNPDALMFALYSSRARQLQKLLSRTSS